MRNIIAENEMIENENKISVNVKFLPQDPTSPSRLSCSEEPTKQI
jgi:hypothetical protein